MKIFKKPLFVSISPNAQKDDIRLALKLFFSPWRWIRGKFSEKFTKVFQTYISAQYVFMFESGRTSLYAVLSALGLKNDEEVLIQAFTCTAAVNPILWVGARPVYVDIEENTYNMSPDDLEKKITLRSKAVIIQHTFGLPAKLDLLLEIAKKHKLIVIEDVAHALGGEYRGRKLGTFGDASIFSFGRYKIISSVFGGAAVTNNPEIGERLKKFYDKCGYPSRFWIFQQLFHPIFLALAKPFYNIFSLGKLAVVAARRLRLISLQVYSEEKSGGKPPFGPSKMPDSLARLGLNQFRKLDIFNSRRAELAKIYERGFLNTPKIMLPKLLPQTRPVFLNFPIQVESADLAYKLIELGQKKEGIYLENWPNKKVVGPRGTDLAKLQYKTGSCPIAEKTAPRVVTLPTGPNISEKDARRVVKFLEESISKLNAI